ncbi:protein HIDE1 isoform X3 [Python bivittatus]|uniref:Protein HIDE1 isoform X3 n=1 Tax=Python bivittatus TaxID=176946 RepID=A0A9F5IN18_PYTBI|nr:protein HIDE1 isoform X3 [Python bivittatus]
MAKLIRQACSPFCYSNLAKLCCKLMVIPMSVCKNKMFHSNVELKVLFLLTGCVASFSRFPSPLIFLDVLSDNVTEGDSLKIACIAPRKYVDAWFFLFKENKSKALKSLPAAESQHTVTFLLENVTTGDGGRYRCQYGLYNGSQLQESEFSHVLEITVKAPACLTACLPDCLPACLNLFATSSPSDPPKYDSKGAASVLPTALSVTGVLLLVLILFAAVGTTGYLKRRRKKKRELNSCWAEASYPTTETSFDSTMFTVSEVVLK